VRVHVISDIEGVAGIVKWGQTGGADTDLFREGRVLYTEEINAAVRGQDVSAVKPYDPGRPCEIEIDFTSTDRVDEYRNRKGAQIVSPRTLVSRADDWWTAWSNFFF